MQMKNKVKSEKGIMTMYVTIAVVTFTIILVALFSLAVATRKNQIKTLIKIKEVYEQDNNKKEEIYTAQKKKLPYTADTVPYYPDNTFEKDSDTNLNDGLVIQDLNGNEYVWIEVPKSLYANSNYNTETTTADQRPANSEDYDKIEYCLHKYTDYYRDETNFIDEYYTRSNLDLTDVQYTALKQKMLKSVYENGGFWIGRYEAGIETNRTASGTPTAAPLSKPGTIEKPVYPYTYVTCSQAQTVANMLTTNDYTGSLMFGVQWDLVLKHIEVKEAAKGIALATIQNALRSDSKEWGNYCDASFTINRGKYAENKDNSLSTTWTPYNQTTSNNFVNSNSVKQVQSNSNGILLTTGASDACKKMNIYDLAGNVSEWTLELCIDPSRPNTARGNNYLYTTSYNSASGRDRLGRTSSAGSHDDTDNGTANSNNRLGFRISLYK